MNNGKEVKTKAEGAGRFQKWSKIEERVNVRYISQENPAMLVDRLAGGSESPITIQPRDIVKVTWTETTTTVLEVPKPE